MNVKQALDLTIDVQDSLSFPDGHTYADYKILSDRPLIR